MLINATQSEELRVAIVDGQKLSDLDIEVPSREQIKGNIYKGKVTRVEPSLEAAFVEYGGNRHGFLPMKEISRIYYSDAAKSAGGRPSIKDAIFEGQELVLQVDKEERGNKGAALTTFISLAGRYLVLMPDNPRAGGVSRRIEGEERQAIKKALNSLEVPNNMGMIVRTAGMGRDQEELQWDVDYLLQTWNAIKKAADTSSAPFLIYQESSLIIRALRDYMRADIGEIIIDSPEVHQEASVFMQQVMPHNIRKLKLYNETIPLFNRYQIENQIESAFSRTVTLPSGGSIVLDPTEALLSIDINSARATKGSDIEETALNTNLESATEIARQLKLRDIGGLVVIDFIDMMNTKNQRKVEDRLRDAVKTDRARTQVGKISRFGLMEMSRQRLRPSLGESSQRVCPRCSGHGTIRTVESLALSILRLIQEEAMKDQAGRINIRVSTPVANYLLNEKRADLNVIEKRFNVPAVIVADSTLVTPEYSLERIRVADLPSQPSSSYELESKPVPEVNPSAEKEDQKTYAAPVVQNIEPAKAAPERKEESDVKPDAVASKGLFSRMFSWLGSSSEEETEAEEKPENKNANNRRGNRRPQRNSRSRQNNNQGNKQNNRQSNRKNTRGNQRNTPEEKQDDNKNVAAKQKQSTGKVNKNQPNDANGNQKTDNRKPPRSNKKPQSESVPQDVNTQQATPSKSADNQVNTKPQDDENKSERTSRSPNRRKRGRRGGRNRRPETDTEVEKNSPVVVDNQEPVIVRVGSNSESNQQDVKKAVDSKAVEKAESPKRASKPKPVKADVEKHVEKPVEVKPVDAKKDDATTELKQVKPRQTKPRPKKASQPKADKPKAQEVKAEKVAKVEKTPAVELKQVKPKSKSPAKTEEKAAVDAKPASKKTRRKKVSKVDSEAKTTETDSKEAPKKAVRKKATRKKVAKKVASEKADAGSAELKQVMPAPRKKATRKKAAAKASDTKTKKVSEDKPATKKSSKTVSSKSEAAKAVAEKATGLYRLEK